MTVVQLPQTPNHHGCQKGICLEMLALEECDSIGRCDNRWMEGSLWNLCMSIDDEIDEDNSDFSVFSSTSRKEEQWEEWDKSEDLYMSDMIRN